MLGLLLGNNIADSLNDIPIVYLYTKERGQIRFVGPLINKICDC